MGYLHRDLQCSLHFRHCIPVTAVVQWNCGRARGPHDRQEKAAGSATAFCPGRPPAPDDTSGAEQHGTAPPRERPAPDGPDTALTPFHARSRFNSRRRAAHHSVPGHAAGPAVGPRQPSGNQALAWTNRPRRPGNDQHYPQRRSMQGPGRPFHLRNRPRRGEVVRPGGERGGPMIVPLLAIGAPAGLLIAWWTARSLSRAEMRQELARACAAMRREVVHWQEAAARATAEAARVAREAEAFKDGCKHGREDVISIMPLLVAAQQRPDQEPRASGDDGS